MCLWGYWYVHACAGAAHGGWRHQVLLVLGYRWLWVRAEFRPLGRGVYTLYCWDLCSHSRVSLSGILSVSVPEYWTYDGVVVACLLLLLLFGVCLLGFVCFAGWLCLLGFIFPILFVLWEPPWWPLSLLACPPATVWSETYCSNREGSAAALVRRYSDSQWLPTVPPASSSLPSPSLISFPFCFLPFLFFPSLPSLFLPPSSFSFASLPLLYSSFLSLSFLPFFPCLSSFLSLPSSLLLLSFPFFTLQSLPLCDPG